MDLGVKLRQARLEAGLSQRQLCGEEITRNMLSQIENGSARPSMDTLQYFATRLGKPVSYFLEEQSVTSPNQSVMEQARNTAGQAVLDALEKYQGPDGIFDRERWLLEALTCLELAQQALQENKKEYARSLLEQAQRAGARTPYYTKDLKRRSELLSYEAGLLKAVAPEQWELFLLARSALEQNAPEKCIGLLQAIDNLNEKHHFLFAQAYSQLSQYERAIEHFHQAEASNPQAVYAGLEKCYSALEDFKQAYFYACKQRDGHPGTGVPTPNIMETSVGTPLPGCPQKTERPARKSNRIPNYDYSQNGAYFITICTKDRRNILSKISVGTPIPGCPDAPTTQLLQYGRIADKYIRQMDAFYDDLSVDKYVIMPDHIHLLISIQNGHPGAGVPTNRTSAIARFIGTFKRFCNKEFGENIWQDRYYDHVIRNQQDYNEIWEYIENNPKKWAITKQGVDL